jgi:hypothetical protein
LKNNDTETGLLISLEILAAFNQQPFKMVGYTDIFWLAWCKHMTSKITPNLEEYISDLFEGSSD